MRAVVALVEARPETIIEDYARVLELAGLAELVGGGPVTLVPQARPGGWFPGAGSPPWQLDGVLSWLGQRQDPMAAEVGGGPVAVVLPTAPAGGPAPAKGWAWEDVMARHGAEPASDHFRHPRSFRAEPALPALTETLPGSLSLAAGLRDRVALLLPVPAWDVFRPVTGSMALLRDLLAPKVSLGDSQSKAEVLADVIRFAGQALPGLGVVMDAVLWQVGHKDPTGPPVARNILLAGRDPVAVDAVATRLTGRDPEREVWFRFCRDQGLGAVREGDIRLTGRTDLLELDFGIQDRYPSLLARGWNRFPLSGLFRRKFISSTLLKKHSRTPWGGLFEDYRAGGPKGD
jgi:hypothetical protein